VHQFFAALAARRHPPDDTPARPVLSPDLYALFARMSPEDRSHGLEMLALLLADGQSDTILLQAGLLHDVGKADSGVGLTHRILRVLLVGHVGWLWRQLSGTPTGWRQSFWVIANHPQRGADRLAERGADEALVELVRYHESVPPAEWAGTAQARRHAALSAMDARC